MISVVIRNKNEAKALEKTLFILKKVYFDDVHEIIVVDNNSKDNSIEIAKKFNCVIVTIDNFTYGKATNLGIMHAKSKYVLLLSSHAVPIGNSFFKNSFQAINNSNSIAGIRYINSIENYNRALENDFIVKQPLHFGLMTGCALVNKEVWEKHKFDQKLVFSEDKEWSERVVNEGYTILDFNETFFYFIERNRKSMVNRFKNETISEYQLHGKKFPSKIKIIASFVKKIIITNTKNYYKTILNDSIILKTKFEILKKLKNNA
ncbi:MAG: glycosyltransferase family 2 protein [Flavobacterium sp.]